jgi:hypothetical protein
MRQQVPNLGAFQVRQCDRPAHYAISGADVQRHTVPTADSNEGGQLFQSDRGHHSNLMAASLVSSRGPVLVMS